jgi:CopG antitoxin of type II toxin-antitoxin system
MDEGKSSISQASTYEEMGEFWDTHSLADYWDQTEPAEFRVNLHSNVTYYAIDHTLSAKISEIARQRGISSETLLNLLVQEKLQELERSSAA